MERKYIFVDCDGTILDVPRGMLKASDKTIYAIKELINYGHMVFIASGRPRCLIPDYLKEIKGLNFLICNGQVSYLSDGRLIGNHKFDQSLVKEINDYCDKQGSLYFDETIDHIYTKELNDPTFIEFVESWGIDINVFKKGQELKECYMMMAAFKNEEMADDFYRHFKGIVDARPQYGFNSCDINLCGISKGSGVNDVLEYFKADKNNAYAFGDGINDIEMLKAVGKGYRMANGNEKLIKVTKLVAPDVLKDGFYQIKENEKLISPIN